MNDYDELIIDLRRHGLQNGSCIGYHSGLCDDAADAIEQLVKERDAAMEDLRECGFRTKEECHFCLHNFAETAADHCLDCDGYTEWQWKGLKN